MLKRLTIDDIYDPDRKANFDGADFADIIWVDDTHFLLGKSDRATQQTDWTRIDLASGQQEPFYDAERMEHTFHQMEGMSAEDAHRLAHLSKYVLNPLRGAAVLNHAGEFYLYEFNSDSLHHLTKSGTCEDFSPDGKWLSFVRDNNLFVWNFATKRETQLTHDGSEQIINGRLDWVYQEELYGRDNFKGHWWSPDSNKIAFLRFDESKLKPFPVTDHVPLRPAVEFTNYPLAGDPNPKVRLGIADLKTSEVSWVDTERYDASDCLIVRIGWTPDSRDIVWQIQDREQHWLDLNVGNTTVLHEERSTWVVAIGEPRWLRDGSFLWISEETGWAHLYRYSADGRQKQVITEGPWEVRSLIAVDEQHGQIYFTGTKDDPTNTHVYRVPVSGGSVEKLTSSDGTHRPFFNPRSTHFVDLWSDFRKPTQVHLFSSDGKLVRSVDDNNVTALADFQLPTIEFLQVPARDRFILDAMIFRPSHFDPSRRYPVLVYVYGGPHHPQVINAWGGEKHVWHRMLAESGYIVWICDNRTGSGRGAQSTWPLHRRTGGLELQDLEDSVDWLKAQPYVDADRIGLWGWSYGGYLTLYALTHSTTFKMGIAGAAVTDWRNYDSIYTERYMDTPQNNPDGYEASSVVKVAASLHGKLLVIHGATDDNVHMQNAIQMVNELQKAGKQFELMIYPRTRHAVTDPLQLKHLRQLMTDFITRNL